MGHHVFVSGAGPIGLMTAMCCKAAGCATVTVTDLVDAKLAKAKEIGARGLPKSFQTPLNGLDNEGYLSKIHVNLMKIGGKSMKILSETQLVGSFLSLYCWSPSKFGP